MAGKSVDSKGNRASDKPGQGKASKSKSFFTDIKFINFNLSDHQKELYSAWVLQGVDLHELSDRCVRGGYKLSFGEEVNTGSIMCTITNRTGDPAFVAHCFTLRGRDYSAALARVLYVHFILCEEDWGVIAAPEADEDRW